ncbi:LEAF RUST 10 DISEASE-RESISTANCE LOCUS RECEPTOR-LIKE PROTEIN KINASE-like 2.1 isoform X2 [Rhododendron vialii]|uniref:LEAF RUST 10 DISEASE-RESISTANCE LOCUS RECEPTOR-LIKE PROTEIN KINASE-like 2.1 isoform X2 n=1 Tax=Rhododendron vialii TaxID=182163 RepID=UPI00265FAA3D|nr:LEAF RUST 10 DISEASE-RESISTANCE LOCUS RECEPTOR-LIKE PROTEIN KINASE-like 2.1 isoform X2 [Rhododendron vialii]
MQSSSPNKTRPPTSPSLEMHSPSSVTATTTTATTILLILGSVAFSCYSQEDGRYFTCLQDFSCGQTIQKVRYPFWGDGRPQFCGHPSFGLKCQNNEYPTIEIDNRAFRVHDIDPSSKKKTITLASSDLWESYCTQELHNITLDDKLFTYGQTNRVLFLFYNCTSEARTINIPYNFTCEIGGIERLGLYTNETFFNGIENSQYTTISCNQSVEVQVFRETVDKLLEGSLTLQEGLRRGFEVVYDANKTICARCQHSGGFCGSDSSEFACHCRDRTYPATCQSPGNGLNVGRKLAIGLGSTGGIMVILLFCIIIKKLKRSEYAFFWKPKTENYRNIEAFLKNCGSLSPKRYTYSDIKKITNSFETELGKGSFGSVFKGKLENGCLVAVKVLKGLKGNGDDFINEVATISRTSHVHIVTLLGFCFEGSRRALVYEFMPNGSLDKFIHDGGSLTYRQLGWEALYQIAIGIARGLEYLHRGCNTRILHFDIKPHNILLNEDFCPKISDFGLAKLCPQKESIISLLGARGTVGYIAPEVFNRNFGGVSHKSDVYSYGMMVLEMVGGRKNISVEVDRTSEIYFPHWIYKRLELDEELGLHGIMDDEANASSRKMIIIGLWCIQIDPSHRPSMNRVVEMLVGSLESLQIPPKPFLSSPPRALVDSSSPLTS